jgi:hypothetical protein
MKLLNVKEDIISIQLNSGRVVLVKEEDFIILHGNIMNKCKVGYDDAEVMGNALKTIFAPEFAELKKLREKKQSVNFLCKEIKFNFKRPEV